MLSFKAAATAFLAKLGKKDVDDNMPIKDTFIHYDDREIKNCRQVKSWHPSYKKAESWDKFNSHGGAQTDQEQIGIPTPDATPENTPRVAGPPAPMAGYNSYDSFDGAMPCTAANIMPLSPAVLPMPMAYAWAVPMPMPAEAHWTTMILRNIPCNYSRQDLLDLLNEHDVRYDFVYLPFDFQKRANLGYAFVNVTSPAEAQRVQQCLNGFSDWSRSFSSTKVLTVGWAVAEQQGLAANIQRYQDSPVMHFDVPDDWKPALFAGPGLERQRFPAPTQRLKRPRGLVASGARGGRR